MCIKKKKYIYIITIDCLNSVWEIKTKKKILVYDECVCAQLIIMSAMTSSIILYLLRHHLRSTRDTIRDNEKKKRINNAHYRVKVRLPRCVPRTMRCWWSNGRFVFTVIEILVPYSLFPSTRNPLINVFFF